MSITQLSTAELAGRPAGDAVTVRGKELAAGATVADARALFASSSVQLVPVLDGTTYLGAVRRDDLPAGTHDGAPIAGYVSRANPTTTASTPLGDALTMLDEDGGDRLVVLSDDCTTYLGMVCLRGDRRHLCIDAECHAAQPEAPSS